MKLRITDLTRWDGEIDRRGYFIWGIILFSIKFCLDFTVSRWLFDRHWSIVEYFRPTMAPDVSTSRDPLAYLATLWVISFPFLAAGVILTAKRLRSAGLSVGWVVLFVVPVIKLILFTILLLLPSRHEAPAEGFHSADVKSWLGIFIPRNRFASAALGVGLSVGYAVLAIWLTATYLQRYAWTLFAGVPFFLGFLPVIIFSYHEKRTMRSCIMLAMQTLLVAAAGALIFAFEGVVCLIMAAPIAGAIAALGAALAYKIQAAEWWRTSASPLLCGVVLTVSLSQFSEPTTLPPAPLLKVTTVVEIDAPPSDVWQHVVSFSELPKPKEFLFRAGIAYPRRARIFGHGPGAIRHCEFSTGTFIEPIETWEPERLLRFSVTRCPPPMEEWTPYHEVHPPHLEGFLVSERGQFRLIALPANRTRLEGTTWYRHHMWPVAYWRPDYIIHQIHYRVLGHIKNLAEASRR